MKSMRIPSRPAPSVDEARNRNSTATSQSRSNQQKNVKKKPPPRPPPPNLNKPKSKSAWNLNQQFDGLSLIDLSPPESPKNFVATRNKAFGGSVSSSYSSSTSSLASSKKSFEYETVNLDPWALQSPVSTNAKNPPSQSTFFVGQSNNTRVVPQLSVPTIIRAQPNKRNFTKNKNEVLQRDNSPPMPSAPPPSPPKETTEVTVPYGIALYDFQASHSDDLTLQVNDVIFLLRRVNNEWLYGRVEDREGMFPANFVCIQVPLPEDDRVVTATYAFCPQMAGDLALRPGQIVHVTGRVSSDWLTGESEGRIGQFPASFVDRIPSTL